MILADTNVLIQAILGEEPDKSLLDKAIKNKQLIFSVISIGEFLAQASSKEEQVIEELINNFPVLLVDLETARMAAKYRKQFLKTKRTHLLDCFLAAQAKLNDLTLVTHNKSDFPMKDIKVISP